MGACYGKGALPAGEGEAPTAGQGLLWDPGGKVLAQGSNKSIFSGLFNGELAVICLARDTNAVDIRRARNEIETLKAMGHHPAIIRMLTHGDHDGKPYLVLEQVDPIGFDLGRLWSQYELVGAKVPSLLCGRLFQQMAKGLQHMHGHRILHLDLKTQNVLVTLDYNAKLCDFGVASKMGSVCQLVAGYMSPELCQGAAPLGAPADCWGLGLILHQMYQRGEWNLVETHRREQGRVVRAKVRDNIPGKRSMPAEVRQAMEALIREDPAKRLTLGGLLESRWLGGSKTKADFERQSGGAWIDIPKASAEPLKWLVPYQGSSRPLTLSVLVGSRQRSLFGRTLGQLGLGNDFPDPENPVITLLVRPPGAASKVIVQPTPQTAVGAGMRLYLGIPADSLKSDKALSFVEKALGYDEDGQSGGDDCVSLMSPEALIKRHKLHEGDNIDKRTVFERGAMYSFAMEFDCFVFPPHIGDEATVGPKPMIGPSGMFAEVKHIALDLRKNFKISLAGIQRVGKTEVEWFPQESDMVRPGDLGLIARCPWEDGSTEPSIDSDTLSKLLVEDKFKTVIRKASDQQAASDGVAQHPKFASVKLYRKPADGEESVGEIPNGTNVKVKDRYENFLLVESSAGSGWVGKKNVR